MSSAGDTRARVVTAIPAIAFAIFIVAEGHLIFALGVIALGVVGLHELYTMMSRVRPVNLAGFLGLIALCLVANYGHRAQLALVLVALIPMTFMLAIVRPRREQVSWAIATTAFGVLWVGMAFAHAILLRKLPHGGGLVVDVLIGTFIGDTAAYFGGRAWGRRPLAPLISPNKTLEGLVAGLVGGTLAFWLFAVLYQDWFKGTDALIIGFSVALAAPVGDLFESLIKRDLAVKDASRFFGAHGGVLDRLDAVLFTAVTAYYVTLAVR
ncbi:MAG: phosphatidate cytidylyltransferase [Thermoleophilaceae bacterium]